MGIEANYVLPVKDHLSVFNCALCSNLVSLDGYVTISCGHCFCRGCFRTWTKTQHSTTAVRGCPKCGVKIASGGNDGVVDWQVQTLMKAQPLVHRMLSQVKVLCPCRFSARTCYWTGDYGDLKQHITSSHEEPTANESTSKSSNTLEPTSEHQESAIGSSVEIESQSERTKQSKSDHIRKSNKDRQPGQVMEERDNPVPRRMTRRRSLSMSDAQSKSKSTASNASKVSHNRRQSRDEDSAEDTSLKRGAPGLNAGMSMGSRLSESNMSRSFPNSEEYQSQKAPSTLMRRYRTPSSLEAMSTPASSPDTALNTDARRHHSGAALEPSNDTSKSTERRPTNERSESPKRSEWPRRKPLENTRTSTSMPTAPDISASRSKVNARFLEKPSDGELTSSLRRIERKKKGSLSPVRITHRDSATIGSASSSPLPPKGQRNQQLTKIERYANLAYKEGKYVVAHDLYTTAIDAYNSAGSPTDVDTELIARLYGNRAAVCLKQSMFKSCVDDCDEALSLNKRLYRACLRKAWALNEMGLFAEACAAVSYGLKDNPGIVDLERELANCKMLRMKFALVQSFLDVKKYEEARSLLLETQSSLRCAVILQCQAELGLGNADMVLEALHVDVLQNEFMGDNAIELIAEAHFQNGNTDQAVQEAKKVQGYSPDRPQNSPRLRLYLDVHSLMLTGQFAAKERRFAKTVESFSAAISMCEDVLPPKAVLLQKLYLLRSDAYLQAKEFPQCLDDTARVISLDDTCVEAWTTRVKALQGMRQYDLVAKELSVVLAKLDDEFLKSAYENALGPPASVDLYDLFGVSRDASAEEIMMQFQIKVAEVQPENFVGEEITEEQRRKMEQTRIYLEKGLSILCDSFKRSQYDAGNNVDSIRTPTDALCRSAKSA